jgi:hypothetical protein
LVAVAASDVIGIQRAIEQYEDIDLSFGTSRECTLLKVRAFPSASCGGTELTGLAVDELIARRESGVPFRRFDGEHATSRKRVPSQDFRWSVSDASELKTSRRRVPSQDFHRSLSDASGQN